MKRCLRKTRGRQEGVCVINDSPTKTANAQSVRHAINAISIRIALHSQRAQLPLRWQSLSQLEFGLDRNSAFYRRSFVSAGACKTNGDASLVRESRPQPFSPHASSPPAASFRRFFLLSLLFPHIFIFSFVLSFTRYSCYDVSTFHARKADVYYRACLAISVPLLMLVLLLQPSLSACTSPEQGVPFLKLPFARVHILGVSSSFHARTRTM